MSKEIPANEGLILTGDFNTHSKVWCKCDIVKFTISQCELIWNELPSRKNMSMIWVWVWWIWAWKKTITAISNFIFLFCLDGDEGVKNEDNSVEFRSQKMSDLRDLLLADKMNTHAISLLLTAQSQVGKKHKFGEVFADGTSAVFSS